MSFRDVKELGEHLKLLGYPRNVQLSIFCTPYGGPAAFFAISLILKWLINRLEPGGTLTFPYPYTENVTSDDLRTESDRVAFIRAVTEFLIVKCGVKVNPRKLYSSSFSAAKELLKITALLLNAPQSIDAADTTDDDDENFESSIDFTETRINDLRKARELSTELTNHGAMLYDLLKKEVTNKEARNTNASRTIEMTTIERSFKSAISTLEANVTAAKEKLDQINADKLNIANKVERKLSELERSKHRLEALKKVRPAYLDEFNKLEDELRLLFAQYITRARCVDALKAQLNATNMRTPSPNNIPIVRPGDTSMTAIFNDDLLDESDEGEEEEEDEVSLSHELARSNIKASAMGRIETKRTQQLRNSDMGPSRRLQGAKMTVHRESTSDLELDSSLNSDESDSAADIGADNLLDDVKRHDGGGGGIERNSFANLSRDPPIGAMSDEDF